MVSTKNKQQAVWEGEPLTLLCQVGGAAHPLSVSWWHTPQDQTQPELVAAMTQDGTVQLGASSRGHGNHGNARLEKGDWATFQLEITSATVTDSGTYECRVSEGTGRQARNLSWTERTAVTVKSLRKCQRVPSLNTCIRLFILQWNLIVCHPESPTYLRTHSTWSLAIGSAHQSLQFF